MRGETFNYHGVHRVALVNRQLDKGVNELMSQRADRVGIIAKDRPGLAGHTDHVATGNVTVLRHLHDMDVARAGSGDEPLAHSIR